MVISQIVNPPDVKCYDIIEKDTYTVIDSLHIECGTTLLLQDNSTLVIRGGMTGEGTIKYGDIGDDNSKELLDLLPQTDKYGNRYYDYRPWGDKNPKIIFESCVEDMNTIEIGNYIDVVYEDKCLPDVDGNPQWSDEELGEYDCIIYNAIGQTLHQGKFKNVYGHDGKIKQRFRNHMILIRIFVEGKWVHLKRIYVDI